MINHEFIEYFHKYNNNFDCIINKKNIEKNKIFLIEKININYKNENLDTNDQLFLKSAKINENELEKTSNSSNGNLNEDNLDDINMIIKENPNKNEKNIKIKGRRKKGENSIRKKTKNSKDNIFRKIKVHFFRFLTKFLNNAIISYFGVPLYIFRKLNNNIIVDTSVEFNKKIFINSTIKKIYSQEISGKYNNCDKNSNKKLIEKLEKIDEFQKIFNLTIKQMYNYYINPKCEIIINKLIGNSENIESFNNFMINEKELTEKNNYNEKSFKIEDYYENLEKMGRKLYEYLGCLKSRPLRNKNKNRILL